MKGQGPCASELESLEGPLIDKIRGPRVRAQECGGEPLNDER